MATVFSLFRQPENPKLAQLFQSFYHVSIANRYKGDNHDRCDRIQKQSKPSRAFAQRRCFSRKCETGGRASGGQHADFVACWHIVGVFF